METLRRPGWWIAVGLFLLHQLTQWLGWHWWLADGYLDPVLFMPVMLGLWLAERRWLFGTERLGGLETIVAGVVLAMIGEEVFPRLEAGFRRDGWDYVAYAIGLGWFWWGVNPRPNAA